MSTCTECNGQQLVELKHAYGTGREDMVRDQINWEISSRETTTLEHVTAYKNGDGTFTVSDVRIAKIHLLTNHIKASIPLDPSWIYSEENFKDGFRYERDIKFYGDEGGELEIHLLDNPDKVEILNLSNQVIYSSETEITSSHKYRRDKLQALATEKGIEMGNTVRMRVTAGSIEPTVFKYRVYDGRPIGIPAIFQPTIFHNVRTLNPSIIYE